jgi:HEAT repeat protein
LPAIPALVKALDDEDRYVRGHVTIALEQIGTEGALKILLKHYQTTR